MYILWVSGDQNYFPEPGKSAERERRRDDGVCIEVTG